MTEQELEQYIRIHYPMENEACEWKEFKSLKHFFSGKAGDDIISYISAIANMEGGHLVIGIEDNTHQIVGIQDFNNHTAQNIKLRLVQKCPNLDSENFSIEEQITSDTGKTVWIFHIPKHRPRQPVYAHSQAWQRMEDSLIKMRSERLDAILKEPIALNDDWSAQIISEASLNDLDEAAIEKARAEYKKKYPARAEACEQWNDVTFLNKAKVTIQGKVTATALLLLGREEAAHFLNPAVARISWVLKNEANREIDYEHFGPPFILNTTQVFNKIRNLTYRYMENASLFPTEIKTYEPYVIREALHNCIAHQDYTRQGRITVVEKPDELIFTNLGSFLPGDVQTVIEQDAPQEFYRNAFMAEAMVNLNMIDTIGSGIKRMFEEQRSRFFPLPDYDLSDPGKVVVKIPGRIWDENYTRLLMTRTDLDLKTVILLDRVQKSAALEDSEIKYLRNAGLIEGRKPNVYISAGLAQATGKKAAYTRNKGLDKAFYKQLILEHIKTYQSASRKEIDELLFDKLPDHMTDKQRKIKINNIIQEMARVSIQNTGSRGKPEWVLKKDS